MYRFTTASDRGNILYCQTKVFDATSHLLLDQPPTMSSQVSWKRFVIATPGAPLISYLYPTNSTEQDTMPSFCRGWR